MRIALHAQSYAPPAGQPGSTAIHKDSSVFVNWAKSCHVVRGYQDISDPSLGLCTAGDSSMATGKAMANGVVSLGDGGSATCRFENSISNGPGFDFAVFENAFNDTFLELAFVEVSSDGVNFVRFASHSLSDTSSQYTNAAVMNATKINNLAGKYRAAYGTPFDLQELAGKPGLDINAITHIRIIDVVGSLSKPYSTFDSYGNKINDPWPTAFPSGGFDLDAIGVIHQNSSTGIEKTASGINFQVYPNPVAGNDILHLRGESRNVEYEICDGLGKTIVHGYAETAIMLPNLDKGLYLLKLSSGNDSSTSKMLVVE